MMTAERIRNGDRIARQVRTTVVDMGNHSRKLGWTMGLEPTTTGITIQDSTN
jgi:hypothetical protein